MSDQETNPKHRFLERMALAIYRTSDERPVPGRKVIAFRTALLIAVATTLATVVSIPLARQVREWNRVGASVRLPADEWRLLLHDPGECAGDRAGERCPASPLNSELWSRAIPRGDPGQEYRAPGWKPRPYRASAYWIGITVPPSRLREAAELHANQLVLGWIHASYRLWIDGLEVQEATGGETTPIMIPMALERLRSAEPMRIAFRIAVDPSRRLLDALNLDEAGRELGAEGHGFFTAEDAQSYRVLMSFWGQGRPVALCLAYTILGALFFLFWIASRIRSEYFYISLFSLVNACYQALRVDFVHYALSDRLNRVLDIALIFLMPMLGTLTALAFSRARGSLIRATAAVTVIVPILAMMLPEGGLTELFKLACILWVVPTCCFSAGLVCAIQAAYLASRMSQGSYLSVRIRRLVLFASANFALGAFYFVMFRMHNATPHRMYWLGTEDFSILLILAAVALSDYREQQALINRTPVSEYHRRPVLPDRLSGVLLNVDLKNSEALFRAGAKLALGGKVVETCLSHMVSAVISEGGVILATDGDGLRAFFDNDRPGSSILRALRATDAMARQLRALEVQFAGEGLADGEIRLTFRAGLAAGEISPIWREAGSERHASWVEAGSSNPIVECTRMMDLERVSGNPTGSSLVMLPEPLANAAIQAQPRLAASFMARGLRLAGKHGRHYECSAYQPWRAAEVAVLEPGGRKAV